MTYADYRLGKAVRALSEAHGMHRKWLESVEFYLFARVSENEVPPGARRHFAEFQDEIMRLQKKYNAPALHIPSAMLTDSEAAELTRLFFDLVASWPGGEDMYR